MGAMYDGAAEDGGLSVSHSDSFIDEVTEEVRRDRLFAAFRRWGWMALALVVLLVGAAAWNEWRKADARAEAEALGDAVVAALTLPEGTARAEALATLNVEGPAEALTNLLAAAETLEADDRVAAVVALDAVASNPAVAPRYSDLATLKLVLLDAGELDPATRLERLEPLTSGAAPYRLLALEQIALARVEEGKTEAAVAILRDVLADGETGQGLRRRATQMIVALGAEVEPT